ncbi:adenosine kinase [Aestuariivirga litoralis]|uniref:adenosine kinase n=1 Tax=Aestuariivirga litoralis TaxID=2650924 RepID=UPI0018C61914|nr:adenosine kinase [Aestuariivirga litoralis]MBG1232014.1 adenosine kinase [Aestuariivirga litoralis]
MKEFDVLTIGNAIVDVIAKVDDGFVVREKLVKGSMNLIDEPRAEQLYGVMGPAAETSGGSAGNTAAGVASFGGKAAYFGKVKEDQLGAIYAHDMKSIGVHFATPKAKDGPATARSFILVTPDGERTMNTYLGACVNLSPADVDAEVVRAAKVTYMEGYLWDKDQAKDAFRAAAKIAHEAGRMTSITLSDSFCVERHRDSFLDLIKGSIDIVFANESEIKSLYKTQNFDGAADAISKHCPLAVLTRSEKGCIVVKGKERVTVPAHPVDKVVDVTGAGDLFASGFLFGHTRGLPLRQCAALGSLAAAEVISHTGARPETNLLKLAQSNGLI